MEPTLDIFNFMAKPIAKPGTTPNMHLAYPRSTTNTPTRTPGMVQDKALVMRPFDGRFYLMLLSPHTSLKQCPGKLSQFSGTCF